MLESLSKSLNQASAETKTPDLILSPIFFPKHHNCIYKTVAEYHMNGLTHPGDH